MVVRSRTAYFGLGCTIGALFAAVCILLRRPHDWVIAVVFIFNMCVCSGVIVSSIAERKGQVKRSQDPHRPLTLFPPDSPQR